MNWLLSLSTFIHVGCAVLLVGGVFFYRVLLLKYAARTGGLGDALRLTLYKRWSHASVGLLIVMLITGFYNLSQKNEAWKASDDFPSPHMIFGIKFLLFVGYLGLTLVLGAKKNAPESTQRKMLTISVILGFIIVLFSAVLSTSY